MLHERTLGRPADWLRLVDPEGTDIQEIMSIELDEEQKWKIVSFGSAVAAAVAVRGLIHLGYRLTSTHEPPLDPLREDADWSDALIFGAATGVTVGLARVLARALAAEVYEEHLPIRERLKSLT